MSRYIVTKILLGLGILTMAGPSYSAQTPCPTTVDKGLAALANGIVDPHKWQVCNAIRVSIGTDPTHTWAILLRSRERQGTNGTGGPAYGVDMIIVDAGKTLYRFSEYSSLTDYEYFVDDTLTSHDLTGKGFAGVVFHSGIAGASDWWSVEHVVVVPPGELDADDVAPRDFGRSWRQTMRWTLMGGVPTVIVARPIDPAGTSDPHFCHGCAKYYQYLAYQWDPTRLAFIIHGVVQSRRDFDGDSDPLDTDLPLIRKSLN